MKLPFKYIFNKQKTNKSIGIGNGSTFPPPAAYGQVFMNGEKLKDSIDYFSASPTLTTCINLLTHNFSNIEFIGLAEFPNAYQTWSVFLQEYLYILKKYGLVYLVRIDGVGKDINFLSIPPTAINSIRSRTVVDFNIKPEDALYNINFTLADFNFYNIKIYESQIIRVYDIAPEPSTSIPRRRIDGLIDVLYTEVKLSQTYNVVLANTFSILSPEMGVPESIVDADRAAEALLEFAGTGKNDQFLKIVKTPVKLQTITVDFKNFEKKDTQLAIRSNIARAFSIDDILVGGSVGTYENTANASLNLFLQNLYPEAKKFCESINILTGWKVDYVKKYSEEQIATGSNQGFNNYNDRYGKVPSNIDPTTR